MKIGKIALAVAGLGFAVSPMAAQAVASDRAVAPITAESEMGGSTTIAVIFGLLALVALVLGTDTNDEAVSP